MPARMPTAIAAVGALVGFAALGTAPDAVGIEGGAYSDETNGTVAIIDASSSEKDQVKCTGSLLSETKVLTVGVCAATNQADLWVRVGSLSWKSGDTLHKVKTYAVNDPIDPDLGIATLETPATGADTVELATGLPEVGDSTEVRGWGLEEDVADGPSSPVLKQARGSVSEIREPDGRFYHVPEFSNSATDGLPLRGDVGAPVFDSAGQQIGIARSTGDSWTAFSFAEDLDWISEEVQSVPVDQPPVAPGPASTDTSGSVAILRDQDTPADSLACTGSLLSATAVLTSASCVPEDGTPLTVRVGSLEWNSGGSVHQVTDHATHRGLAVLTLGSPATNAETVQLTPHEPGDRHTLEIRGWGNEGADGNATALTQSTGWNRGLHWRVDLVTRYFTIQALSGWTTKEDIGGPAFNSVGQQVGVVDTAADPERLNYSIVSVPDSLEWIIREARLS